MMFRVFWLSLGIIAGDVFGSDGPSLRSLHVVYIALILVTVSVVFGGFNARGRV